MSYQYHDIDLKKQKQYRLAIGRKYNYICSLAQLPKLAYKVFFFNISMFVHQIIIIIIFNPCDGDSLMLEETCGVASCRQAGGDEGSGEEGRCFHAGSQSALHGVDQDASQLVGGRC